METSNADAYASAKNTIFDHVEKFPRPVNPWELSRRGRPMPRYYLALEGLSIGRRSLFIRKTGIFIGDATEPIVEHGLSSIQRGLSESLGHGSKFVNVYAYSNSSIEDTQICVRVDGILTWMLYPAAELLMTDDDREKMVDVVNDIQRKLDGR